MNLNLISAVLLTMWLAGWVLASVWAVFKARGETLASPGRPGHPGPPAWPVANRNIFSGKGIKPCS